MYKANAIVLLILVVPLCLVGYAIAPAPKDAPEVFVEEDAFHPGIRTLGEVWGSEIEGRGEDEADPSGEPLDFDLQGIHQSLKKLELDRRGHIKLNGITRQSLEEALSSTALALTDYDLKVLHDSILDALPEETGREASELLLSYFRYLRAKELTLKSEHLLVEIEDLRAHQAALSELRAALLGTDRAKRLFRKSEDDRAFMLESMALSTNVDLSPEERTSRIEMLGEKYHQYAPPIEEWSLRSSRFVERLRAYDDSDEWLRRSAYELLTEEFSESEIDLIREYRIDLFEPV